MTYAYDIPGYICGHRCASGPRFYDAANMRFYDLAGHSRHGNYLERTVGTPTFDTVGPFDREGIVLDNSCQWRVPNPIAWEGTMIAWIAPRFPNDNASQKIWTHGDAVTFSSNGTISLASTFVVGVVNSSASTPAAALVFPALNWPNGMNNILAMAFATSQMNRQVYSSQNGVVVNTSAAAAAGVNGNPAAMGWNGNTGLSGSVGARYIHVGRIKGSTTDVAADATHSAVLLEQHFFKNNPGGTVLSTHPTEVAAFMADRTAYYGAQ